MPRKKHFDLGAQLAMGQLPMFMTGKEIQQHLKPFDNDRQRVSIDEPDPEEWGGKKRRPETDKEMWSRKYDESVTHWRDDGADHDEKYNNLAHDIAHQGFKNPIVPVNFANNEVLGSHHRVAVGAEEHPNHLFPVVHYDDIHDARANLGKTY